MASDAPNEVPVRNLRQADRHPIDTLGLRWASLHEVYALSDVDSLARIRMNRKDAAVRDLVRSLGCHDVSREEVTQDVPLVRSLSTSFDLTQFVESAKDTVPECPVEARFNRDVLRNVKRVGEVNSRTSNGIGDTLGRRLSGQPAIDRCQQGIAQGQLKLTIERAGSRRPSPGSGLRPHHGRPEFLKCDDGVREFRPARRVRQHDDKDVGRLACSIRCGFNHLNGALSVSLQTETASRPRCARCENHPQNERVCPFADVPLEVSSNSLNGTDNNHRVRHAQSMTKLGARPKKSLDGRKGHQDLPEFGIVERLNERGQGGARIAADQRNHRRRLE